MPMLILTSLVEQSCATKIIFLFAHFMAEIIPYLCLSEDLEVKLIVVVSYNRSPTFKEVFCVSSLTLHLIKFNSPFSFICWSLESYDVWWPVKNWFPSFIDHNLTDTSDLIDQLNCRLTTLSSCVSVHCPNRIASVYLSFSFSAHVCVPSSEHHFRSTLDLALVETLFSVCLCAENVRRLKSTQLAQ